MNKKFKLIRVTATILLLTVPQLTLAAPTTYKELVKSVLDFINILIPAIFGIAFIYFVWKIIDSWILHADEQSKREDGRRYAISAVIAFVVMVSAWGIVALLKNSFLS